MKEEIGAQFLDEHVVVLLVRRPRL